MSRHLVPDCGYFKLCSLTLSKDMSSCAKWCFLLGVEYQNFIELIKILTVKLGSQTGPVDMVFGDVHTQKLRGEYVVQLKDCTSERFSQITINLSH